MGFMADFVGLLGFCGREEVTVAGGDGLYGWF